MKTITCLYSLALLILSSACFAAERPVSSSIRQAVPVEAHLAVYGRHNPERDYQTPYWEDVWHAVQDERLFERALEIVTSRMSPEDLEGAKSVLEEVKSALEPMDWATLADFREVVYFQVMEVPFNHHLVLARLTPEAASSCEASLKNLFAVIQRLTHGGVLVHTEQQGSVAMTTLGLPKEVPFHPTIARAGDVLLISTTEPVARRSLAMLLGTGGDSKFDDPRLQEALTHLPEPEDSLVFFDGRQLFTQLRGIGSFIQEASRGDPGAARVA
jgi:hypothetical protein